MKTEVILRESSLFLIMRVDKPRYLAMPGRRKLIPNWPTKVFNPRASNSIGIISVIAHVGGNLRDW